MYFLIPAGSGTITVTGLSNGIAYTFTVVGNTNYGVASAASAASNSITPAPSVIPAFESIASTLLGTTTSVVTFSSIPSTYKHLQIRITARSNVSANSQELSFTYNGDTSGNYGRHILWGDGSSVNVDGRNGSDPANYLPWVMGNNATANIFGAMIVDILDYRNTSKTRTIAGISSADRNGAGFVALTSGHYNGTEAVSSINIVSQGGNNYIAGTSIALYGIRG